MAGHPHLLLVSVGAQGHINPARHLAHRLARFAGARVTVAVPTNAYRRMFKSSIRDEEEDDNVDAKGLVTYVHYSDGTEEGLNPATDLPKVEARIVASLTRLAEALAARDRPVTCIVYALLLSMAADVARSIGVPSVLFWIQPAAVFAIYHRYFGGYCQLITNHVTDPSFAIELPGLIPLRIRELPSFLTNPNADDDPYYFLFSLFRSVFRVLDREISSGSKPAVLVNSFEELEAGVISSIDDVDVFAVGPLVSPSSGHDLFDHDTSNYMEWLDKKDDKSVAYVSFGSLSVLSKNQMVEIRRGLRDSGVPYLWVIRKDSRVDGGDYEEEEEEGKGMVVEWCEQVKVLSHRSVGCFVTHCGWNSTTESMMCGVPTVMLPQWTDQATNARLVEGMWGTGVVAEAAGEGGVVQGKELKRCLDAVMGEGERAVGIRKKAEMWRDKAREAVKEEGSSVVKIRAFVERFKDVQVPRGFY